MALIKCGRTVGMIADEDGAYISNRMLRVGTSDDARDSTVVNMPEG